MQQDRGHPSPGLSAGNCSVEWLHLHTECKHCACLGFSHSVQCDCTASLPKNFLQNYLNCLYKGILSDFSGYFHPVCNNLLVPFSHVAAGSAQPQAVLVGHLLLSLSEVPKPDYSERCIGRRTEKKRSLTQRSEERSE